jgi:hypothetical protein
MDLGSGIWKKPIPDPGSRGQKGTGSRIRIRNTVLKVTVDCSVAVPDPNPDPYVFGPTGSGSISQRYGSGFFYRPLVRGMDPDPSINKQK